MRGKEDGGKENEFIFFSPIFFSRISDLKFEI
jgi:hypothetical protein